MPPACMHAGFRRGALGSSHVQSCLLACMLRQHTPPRLYRPLGERASVGGGPGCVSMMYHPPNVPSVRPCMHAGESWTRYKFVVQVFIAEQRGEGVR